MCDPKSSSYGSGNLNEDLVILLLLRNRKTCGVISYTSAKIWSHLFAMACDCYKREYGDGTSEILPQRGTGGPCIENNPQQEDTLDLSSKDLRSALR